MDIETNGIPSRKYGYLEALGRGRLSRRGGWRYPAFSWVLHRFTQREPNLLLFVVQLDSGVAQVKARELCKMWEMWKGGRAWGAWVCAAHAPVLWVLLCLVAGTPWAQGLGSS